jgi:hypothetical protein
MENYPVDYPIELSQSSLYVQPKAESTLLDYCTLASPIMQPPPSRAPEIQSISDLNWSSYHQSIDSSSTQFNVSFSALFFLLIDACSPCLMGHLISTASSDGTCRSQATFTNTHQVLNYMAMELPGYL